MENRADEENGVSRDKNAGQDTGEFSTPGRTGGSDRRISRTRRALREALIALIEEKGYESITVEEITNRANLGRATFYLHYKDKDDLLLEEFNELVNDRVHLLSQIPLTAWRLGDFPEERQPLRPLLLAFQHVAENPALYRLVLRGDSAQRVSEKIRQIITRAINGVIQARMENYPLELHPQVPVDFLASFFSGAFLGSISWWLEQENPVSPEEVARMFQRTFFPGAKKVMGVTLPR